MITQEETLARYCAQTDSCGSGGIVDVIRRATSDPTLYIFGELLDLPSVQALAGTEHDLVLKALQIMSTGTYRDYVSLEGCTELDSTQVKKLRQLTVVTLAGRQNVIPYAMLMKELELASVRELEDILIGIIYRGLVRGKMDQMHNRFLVTSATSRDVVAREHVEALKDSIVRWKGSTAEVLAEIDARINSTAESWRKTEIKKRQLAEERERRKVEQKKPKRLASIFNR